MLQPRILQKCVDQNIFTGILICIPLHFPLTCAAFVVQQNIYLNLKDNWSIFIAFFFNSLQYFDNRLKNVCLQTVGDNHVYWSWVDYSLW